MQDDETPTSNRSPEATDGAADFPVGSQERAYDFFKHLTTINLASIGGVFGLLKGGDIEISASSVLAIVACLTASGLMSIACLSQIARRSWDAERKGGIKASHLNAYQGFCVLVLLVGLGIFTGNFLGSLVEL